VGRRKKMSDVSGKVKEATVPYELFSRITFDAHVMGGQACIRGMRIPVSLVLNLFANGMKANLMISLRLCDMRPGLQERKFTLWQNEFSC